MAAKVPIVDCHVHYWEPATAERPWHPGGDVPGPPLLVEHLLDEARAAGVDRVVGITLRLMGEDNRYMLEGAERFPAGVAAVFGRVDPRGSDLDARLDALAAHHAFAGVRFTIFTPAEHVWFGDGTLDRFLAAAAARRLAVAIFCAAPSDLGALAARHPECTVLADHICVDHRPAMRDPSVDAFANWADVLALAKLPNVSLKVSNLPELSRQPFPFDDIHERIYDLYAAFGPQRLIWGSNYPPSKERASYAESVRYFTGLSGIPDAHKARIMGGNLIEILNASKGTR